MTKKQARSYKRKWYLAHKDDQLAKQKVTYALNRPAILQRQRAYRMRNLKAIRAKDRERARASAPIKKVYYRGYYLRNREIIKARARAHAKANRAKRNARFAERMATDVQFSLRHTLAGRVSAALNYTGNRKAHKTMELVGCSISVLRAHIESLWLAGMSWENRGEWHLDHKRPCDSFDLSNPREQKECFHFSNLQPLWALDNYSKGAKWSGVVL